MNGKTSEPAFPAASPVHAKETLSHAEWAGRKKGLVNYDRSPGYALERFAVTVTANL